jgi:hypothetical protein
MPPRKESAAKRALRNRDAQRTQDDSLADFLANRNVPIPNGLKRIADDADGQGRNVRRRGIEQDTIDGEFVSGNSNL